MPDELSAFFGLVTILSPSVEESAVSLSSLSSADLYSPFLICIYASKISRATPAEKLLDAPCSIITATTISGSSYGANPTNRTLSAPSGTSAVPVLPAALYLLDANAADAVPDVTTLRIPSVTAL